MEQSNKELFTALAKAQSSYRAVKKSGVNTYFNNSRYPTLSDFIEASIESLTSNGLTITQGLQSKEDGSVWIITTLGHSSGESISSSFKLIVSKNDMQSLGSAVTYGRRYAYAAVAGLAPEDDDGNEAAGNEEKDSKKQSKPLVNHAPTNKEPALNSVQAVTANTEFSSGKFKGKKFKDVPLSDIRNYADWMKAETDKSGKQPSLILNQMLEYLSQDHDEIPF